MSTYNEWHICRYDKKYLSNLCMFWFSDCNDPLLFLDGSITAISGQNNNWTPAIIWSFPQFRESQFRKSQVSLRWWSIELQALRTGIGSCVGSAQDRIDEPFLPFSTLLYQVMVTPPGSSLRQRTLLPRKRGWAMPPCRWSSRRCSRRSVELRAFVTC